MLWQKKVRVRILVTLLMGWAISQASHVASNEPCKDVRPHYHWEVWTFHYISTDTTVVGKQMWDLLAGGVELQAPYRVFSDTLAVLGNTTAALPRVKV